MVGNKRTALLKLSRARITIGFGHCRKQRTKLLQSVNSIAADIENIILYSTFRLSHKHL